MRQLVEVVAGTVCLRCGSEHRPRHGSPESALEQSCPQVNVPTSSRHAKHADCTQQSAIVRASNGGLQVLSLGNQQVQDCSTEEYLKQNIVPGINIRHTLLNMCTKIQQYPISRLK